MIKESEKGLKPGETTRKLGEKVLFTATEQVKPMLKTFAPAIFLTVVDLS